MNKAQRRPLIAGNWKMNLAEPDVLEVIDKTAKDTVDVAVCVPPTVLYQLKNVTREIKISLGAQDISAHDEGAFTGEVSGLMLAYSGAEYCIIGHSERRRYHGETNLIVMEKIQRALEYSLKPILCVGETLEERELVLEYDTVRLQLRSALNRYGTKVFKNIVIAYEPVWAIGTGKTASSEQAEEMCAFIRADIKAFAGVAASRRVRILYGGSMNEKNTAELLAQPNIDGGLIGGASLDATKFAKIIEAADNG
ncbi:MAG: triose-phosphate isomerase [Oscillospiraceae bacterium]|jgi:triosephosphate isomerase|nr:triose-phosphate isomerase [Oscillospiraceae bacterium]